MKVSELTVGQVIDHPDDRGYVVLGVGERDELGYQIVLVGRNGRLLVLYLRHDAEVELHEEAP